MTCAHRVTDRDRQPTHNTLTTQQNIQQSTRQIHSFVHNPHPACKSTLSFLFGYTVMTRRAENPTEEYLSSVENPECLWFDFTGFDESRPHTIKTSADRTDQGKGRLAKRRAVLNKHNLRPEHVTSWRTAQWGQITVKLNCVLNTLFHQFHSHLCQFHSLYHSYFIINPTNTKRANLGEFGT